MGHDNVLIKGNKRTATSSVKSVNQGKGAKELSQDGYNMSINIEYLGNLSLRRRGRSRNRAATLNKCLRHRSYGESAARANIDDKELS